VVALVVVEDLEEQRSMVRGGRRAGSMADVLEGSGGMGRGRMRWDRVGCGGWDGTGQP